MDGNPALMRLTIGLGSNADYVRGGEFLADVLAGNDLTEVTHLSGGTDTAIRRDHSPHLYFLSISTNDTILDFMRDRTIFFRERFIIDITGPVLYPDAINPDLNPEGVIEELSRPEVQDILREQIMLADLVTVSHSSFVEMIEPLNKNIYLLPDFSEDSMLEFLQSFTRAMTLASNSRHTAFNRGVFE